MANVVLFRAGQPPQLLLSVETSLYISDPDAIINPDLSGVSGIPLKYFKRSGNNVIVMNATEQAAVDAADVAAVVPATVNSNQVILYDDFISAVAGNLGWTATNSGTGAAAATNSTLTSNTNIGVLQFSTGTTATGRSALSLNVSAFAFGGGQTIFETLIRIEDLSTASERFKIYAGFGDLTAAGDMVDGAYFSYIDTESSGQWQCNTASNSVRTALGSGVTVAADIWYKLRAVVNDAGTLASFFVNGVWVGNITTNIPTTNARATGLIHKIEKSVGLTARLSYMDYFYMSKMVTR